MHMCIFYTHICTYRDTHMQFWSMWILGNIMFSKETTMQGFHFAQDLQKVRNLNNFYFVLSLPVASPLLWTNVNSFT